MLYTHVIIHLCACHYKAGQHIIVSVKDHHHNSGNQVITTSGAGAFSAYQWCTLWLSTFSHVLRVVRSLCTMRKTILVLLLLVCQHYIYIYNKRTAIVEKQKHNNIRRQPAQEYVD